MVGMKYRKLRIAFSATCGILCLLLIALWVRGLIWSDCAKGNICATHLTIISFNHTLSVLHHRVYPQHKLGPWQFRSERRPQPQETWRPGYYTYRGNDGGMQLRLPYWFLVGATSAISTLPWITIRWRFSLRTLLIAMTLVAVVLGAVVWAVK
jgi:hypothetical protein